MKKTSLILAIALLFGIPAFSAEDTDPFGVRRSLKDEVYVVETDEEMAAESLERISGDIDLGFTLPEQTVESEHHYKAGPFGRQDAMEKAKASY